MTTHAADIRDVCVSGSFVYVLHDSKRVITKMAFLSGPETVSSLVSLLALEPPASPRARVVAQDAVTIFLSRVARMAPADVCTYLPQPRLHALLAHVRSDPTVRVARIA